MCYRSWRQFWLLLWKNWLLQKKRVILTVFIVLVPISLALVSVLITQTTDSEAVRVVSEETFGAFSVTPDLTNFGKNEIILAYAPKTKFVARIMTRAATLMGVNISPGMTYYYAVC